MLDVNGYQKLIESANKAERTIRAIEDSREDSEIFGLCSGVKNSLEAYLSRISQEIESFEREYGVGLNLNAKKLYDNPFSLGICVVFSRTKEDLEKILDLKEALPYFGKSLPSEIRQHLPKNIGGFMSFRVEKGDRKTLIFTKDVIGAQAFIERYLERLQASFTS